MGAGKYRTQSSNGLIHGQPETFRQLNWNRDNVEAKGFRRLGLSHGAAISASFRHDQCRSNLQLVKDRLLDVLR